MHKEILISIDENESRVAVLEDGELMELYVGREERQIGSIYKGKVANVLPGMQAAFVDIGLERNAFLCVNDALAHLGDYELDDTRRLSIKDILKVNQETLVQIIKESAGNKGARATTYLTLPGRYLVLLPSAHYIGISRRIEDEAERERLRVLMEEIKPKNMGLIVRTAAEYRGRDDMERDLEFLLKLWDKICQNAKKKKAPALVHQELALVYKVIRDVFTAEVDKLSIDSSSEHEKVLELLEIISPALRNRVHLYAGKRPLFDVYGLEVEIDKALRNKVWLDSGGYLIIDKTEALAVIDVNTGKYIGKTNLADTILRTNLEAVQEISRQLRLRDIGGIVIIDFIDMDRAEDRGKVMSSLAEALKRDRTKTHIVGMTELGLVQITRKRVSRDLDETLRDNCPCCNGRGRVLSLETLRIKAEREIRKTAQETRSENLVAIVNPRLAVPLLGWEGEGLQRLEMQTGKKIHLRVEKDYFREKIEISEVSPRELAEKYPSLEPGQEILVKVEDAFGLNLQSGVGYYGGIIVEVLGGGNLLGRKVSLVIQEVGRFYCKGQVKE
jgi:ribonuclease G